MILWLENRDDEGIFYIRLDVVLNETRMTLGDMMSQTTQDIITSLDVLPQRVLAATIMQ